MSHTILRPFNVKVSVLGYFPLYGLYNRCLYKSINYNKIPITPPPPKQINHSIAYIYIYI